MTVYSRGSYLICLRLGVCVAGIIGLAACGTTSDDVDVTEPVAEVEEVEVAPAPELPLPPYVKGKGYALTWMMNQTGAISVPKEIADRARNTCIRVGHEKSYAYTIEFNGEDVTGYFRCSGSGS